ncbi:MAG: hydrogenase subunit MbhD domain-containing protein, partial [Bacteroidales bacterium]
MEILLSVILGFMIIGAIFALHANDLLSAVIAQGIVGYGLVICFLHLKAPDLAIVQIVVETITLIIMV